VDRAAAARFWPGESPVGKRVKLGRLQSASEWATVIGLVGDIRHDAIDVVGVPHIYFSIYQLSGESLGLVVRSASDPTRPGAAVRSEIQAVDAGLPVFGIRTFSSLASDSMTPQRFSGVSTRDPVVFVAVPVFLITAAVLASYLPARQATRIDPIRALRAD